MFYVIELQTNETGAVNVFTFTERADAEEKYHDILRYASKSKVRKHGAMIVTEDFFTVKSEVYSHENVDQE